MDPSHHFLDGMEVGAAAENAQAMADATLEMTMNPPAKPAAASNGASARHALVRAMGLSDDDAALLWRSFDDTAKKQEGPYERTALLLFNAEAEDIQKILFTLGAADALADDVFVGAALARIAKNYAPGEAYHRAWLQRYMKLISQTVKVGGVDIASRVGLSFTLENPRAQAVIRQRAADLVTQVTETTKQQIREAIYEGRLEGESVRQIAKRIEAETFGEIAGSRALTIARTETVGALNAGAFTAAEQSRVMRSKQWLTQGDGRVRDSHAAIDGERVDIGAAFTNGLRYPHDPMGPAEEVINCRCSLAYSDLEAGAG
jgi:F like protein